LYLSRVAGEQGDEVMPDRICDPSLLHDVGDAAQVVSVKGAIAQADHRAGGDVTAPVTQQLTRRSASAHDRQLTQGISHIRADYRGLRRAMLQHDVDVL